MSNKCEKGSVERLLLKMYTLMPPVRIDYWHCRLYEEGEEEKEEGNNIRRGENYILTLKHYKTDKKYGTLVLQLPKELEEEIKMSEKKGRRSYLFETQEGREYKNKKQFVEWATRKLRKITGNKNITLTMLRHIYISRRDLKLESKSGSEQREISSKMCHSISQQRKYSWHSWKDL